MKLADWYDILFGTRREDKSKNSIVNMGRNPPKRGFGGTEVLNIAFSFEERATKSEVKATREEIK